MDSATPAFNKPAQGLMDYLLSRRSGSAKAMTEPGPSAEQLDTILKAAARAPDHGKLAPWRFILFEGEARARFGAFLAQRIAQIEADVSEPRIELERGRFLRAPIVIGVVSRVTPGIPIPQWEQELSAGAVCTLMLIAAHAEGFVANWITEWYAYDPVVARELGLGPTERIAGFVYIGTAAAPLEERVRPDMAKIVSRY